MRQSLTQYEVGTEMALRDALLRAESNLPIPDITAAMFDRSSYLEALRTQALQMEMASDAARTNLTTSLLGGAMQLGGAAITGGMSLAGTSLIAAALEKNPRNEGWSYIA